MVGNDILRIDIFIGSDIMGVEILGGYHRD